MDEKCDIVTCWKCKTCFCYECCAKMNPIKAHGSHYHRPKCVHYSHPIIEEMNIKCEECKKAGQICNQPQDLEDGDIPIAERLLQ